MTAHAGALDVLAPEHVIDPYPFFAHMRRQHPVHRDAQYRAWFVYRHHDVLAALRDPGLSSDRVMPVYRDHFSPQQQRERKPTFDILQHWMVFMDPPDHTRLRKLVMPAFSAKAIGALRPRIEAVVGETLAELADRDEFDLVRDLAHPIPAVVIAEMLGVPRADRDRFKTWSDQILLLIFGSKTTADRGARGQEGLVELADYLRHFIRLRRADPRDDLVSALIASDRADPPLTEDEMVATCALLIFGGHETTTNLIANGIRALLHRPDQWSALRAEPDLRTAAVEELLRFDGPSKMIMRRAIRDVEIGGVTVPAGDSVYLVQGSANRDETVFEAPDVLDVRRNPNRHVSFGFGIHHCIGAFLARLECMAVLDALARNMPDLGPVAGTEQWVPTLISRGMQSYRVACRG